MKKLLALLLAMVMLLSLAACSETSDDDEDDVRGSVSSQKDDNKDTEKETDKETDKEADKEADEEADKEADKEADQDADMDADKDKVEVGTSKNNTYKNTFAGITCTLGSDWTFMTDAEIKANNELTMDMMGDNYAEAIKNATYFTDMMATHTNGMDTINVVFEKLTGVNQSLTEEQYANLCKDSTKGALESMGMTKVTITVEKGIFAGEEHNFLAISGEFSGVPVYERLVVLRCGSYAVSVTACTWYADTCKTILDSFKAI